MTSRDVNVTSSSQLQPKLSNPYLKNNKTSLSLLSMPNVAKKAGTMAVTVTPPTSHLKPRKSAHVTTLKSQLKAEIAALHRQKKLREQQKIQQLKIQERMQRQELAQQKQLGHVMEQLLKKVELKVDKDIRSTVKDTVDFMVQSVLRRHYQQHIGSWYCQQQRYYPPKRYYPPFYDHTNQIYSYGGFLHTHASFFHFSHGSAHTPTMDILTQHSPSSLSTTRTIPRKHTSKPMFLHSNPIDDVHSPYRHSYQILPELVCLSKQSLQDSFGVMLTWDCKSVLVPKSDSEVENPGSNKVFFQSDSSHLLNTAEEQDRTTFEKSAFVSTSTDLARMDDPLSKPRRKRRQRVNYGVMMVSDAQRATFVAANSTDGVGEKVEIVPFLRPGDIVLTINSHPVGGLLFAEACHLIASTSATCPPAGNVHCVLKVARRNSKDLPESHTLSFTEPDVATENNDHSIDSSVCLTVKNSSSRVDEGDASATASIADPQWVRPLPMTVSMEFSPEEWLTLLRAMSKVSRKLSTGTALLPISLHDVLKDMQKSSEYQNIVINVDLVIAKLSKEGKYIDAEMSRLAEMYWASQWKVEVENDDENENNALFSEPLTDSKRSSLRSLPRPWKGCRCCSMTHEFVNDPKCVLYRDVKSFQNGENSLCAIVDTKERTTTMSRNKEKNALKAAYIERFMKIRSETEANRQEAAFVLEMELKQIAQMKKAVFAPSSLCTMVIFAVAEVMKLFPKDEYRGREEFALKNLPLPGDACCTAESSEDDEEDLPLNALVERVPKRNLLKCTSPTSKRLKIIKSLNTIGSICEKKPVPSPYCLAEILRHISKTYGHLFKEPPHREYAWQQRHRSTLLQPLPKRVMFQENPRTPGTLSFENIQFILNDERMTRLWKTCHDPLPCHRLSTAKGTFKEWKDELIVAHLSSISVTGLLHEIYVLESIKILEINPNGSIVLREGWQRQLPLLVLNDMRHGFKCNLTPDLYCMNETIKSTLGNTVSDGDSFWKYVKEENIWQWRCRNDENEKENPLWLDNEEYHLRKQIFQEKFDDFVNKLNGVGDFCI